MRRMFLILPLILLACGEPRSPVMSFDKAKNDRRRLDVSVHHVYDALKVPLPTESSHLIEVDVLDGPSDLVGKRITLPYDEWMRGEPPPKAGERLQIAPADWVNKAPGSKGEPMGGFGHKSSIE